MIWYSAVSTWHAKPYLRKYCIRASISLSSSPFPYRCFLHSTSRFAKYGHLKLLLLVSACSFCIKASAFDILVSNCITNLGKSNSAQQIATKCYLKYVKWQNIYRRNQNLSGNTHHFICHVWKLAVNEFWWMNWIIEDPIRPVTIILQQTS